MDLLMEAIKATGATIRLEHPLLQAQKIGGTITFEIGIDPAATITRFKLEMNHIGKMFYDEGFAVETLEHGFAIEARPKKK